MFIKILLKIAVNALAIYLASIVLDGVKLNIEKFADTGSLLVLGLLGLAIYVANELIKPAIKVLTFPLILVTFGVFNIIINIFLIWSVDTLFSSIEIQGILPLIWTTILVSLINSLLFFL